MRNFIIKSLGSGAGKSAVTLGLLGALKARGLNYMYFKPIAITNDVCDCGGELIPAYIQVISDYMSFGIESRKLCPLLFVPLQEDEESRDAICDKIQYNAYVEGKLDVQLSGSMIPEYIWSKRNLITEECRILREYGNLIVEDIGDYRTMGFLLQKIGFAIKEFQDLYIVRPEELDPSFLHSKMCIITKSNNVFPNAPDVDIIGNIPYKSDLENLMIQSSIDKWVIHVSKHVDISKLLCILS